MKVQVHTFGCKVNTYDTGLIEKRMQAEGLAVSPAEHGDDVSMASADADQIATYVLNSCAVTAEATREVRRVAARIKRKNPQARVVLTGCAAQVDGAEVDSDSNFDLIVANSHKAELASLVRGLIEPREKITPSVYRQNIFRQSDLGQGGGEEAVHSRAFIKIQDGCDSFCTFCIIPYARGTSRSLSVGELIERTQELSRQGYLEVVLTGVHIGDYRDPHSNERLEDLVRALLQFTSISRVRLSSLEPPELTPELIELYQDERLCRHFHMSIQSAQSRVLKDMKRQYSAEDVETALKTIENKVPGAFVGMDVITGFPGESADDFKETFERLRSLPWTRLHVFPYSERKGTRAAVMAGSVPISERRARASELRTLSSERYRIAGTSQIGSIKKALVLKSAKNGVSQGLTRDFWPVRFDEWHDDIAGREIDVEVLGFEFSASRMDQPLRVRRVGAQ